MRESNFTLLVLIWVFLLPLLPIFLLQALYTRARALKLPDARPPYSGRYGNSEVPFHLVGFGDSVIAGTGLSQAEQSITSKLGEEIQRKTGNLVNWSCYGVNGDRLKDLLERVDSIPECEGNLVVVSVGVNDVTRLTSLKAWRRDLRALINKLRGRFDRLLFLGLPPMEDFPILPFPLRFFLGLRASMLNFCLAKETEIFHDVFHLEYYGRPSNKDMAEDGYHPSEVACEDFAKIIVNALAFD